MPDANILLRYNSGLSLRVLRFLLLAVTVAIEEGDMVESASSRKMLGQAFGVTTMYINLPVWRAFGWCVVC